MGRGKAWFAAALFIGLTALKILMPEYGETLRERLLDYIDTDGTCLAVIGNLGELFYQRSLKEGIIAALNPQNEEDSAGEGQPPALPEESGAQAASIAAQTRTEALPGGETPAPVEAFLRRQAEFSERQLPDNVRSDMPELGFEYVRPAVGSLSSGFGYRIHPIDNAVSFHYGADIAADSGDDIFAFADGCVYLVGESESSGKYLILTHADGYATVYAHCSEITAREGDTVKRGQSIARVGQSGNATGPHLHFELLQNDVYLNAEYYI